MGLVGQDVQLDWEDVGLVEENVGLVVEDARLVLDVGGLGTMWDREYGLRAI